MSGTAYAIAEIVVFLVGATIIGFLLGRLTAKRSASPVAEVEPSMVANEPKPAKQSKATATAGPDLEQARRELSDAKAELASATNRIEELDRELTLAKWQIGELEKEFKVDAPDVEAATLEAVPDSEEVEEAL